MNIEVYEQEINAEIMALLLMADPNEKNILSYLPNATILVCKDNGKFISVALITEIAKEFELKNIAVLTEHQGEGIAKSMINEVKKIAKNLGAKTIDVGTGNSSLSQLALYQKCGFRMHSIESGFFNSYPEPIFENGIRCIDMIKLRAQL